MSLRETDRARCRIELDAALGALRLLLNDGVESPERHYRSVVEAVCAACDVRDAPPVKLRIQGDSEVSATTGQFVADFVAEAIRNVVKHARAELIELTVAAKQNEVSIVVLNDGVGASGGHVGTGAGLRLLAARALDHGCVVSAGATSRDGWTTTLTLAAGPDVRHATADGSAER